MRQIQDHSPSGVPAVLVARPHRRLLPPVGRSELLSLAFAIGFALLALTSGLRAPPPAGDSATSGRPLDELDRQIGQMLVFGFAGSAAGDRVLQPLLAEIHAGTVGGVVLLGRNIGPRRRLTALVSALHGADPPLPLLVAIDQEGGRVQRLGPGQAYADYPSAAAVARSSSPQAAGQLYQRLAEELSGLGIKLNLGPVVDLARNERNPVIARLERSFGAQSTRVTDYARAFISAHARAGILVALKHFPGHGSSISDSHAGPVDITATWSDDELEPFRQLTGIAEPPIVMTGHLSHAVLTGDANLPATLSRQAIEGRLRGDLGFAGVVMTDDLEMDAIGSRFSLEETVVGAINAGNDLLLFASAKDVDPAFRARVRGLIRRAVNLGKIPRRRIEASFERIRSLKARLVPKALVAGG